MSFRKTHPKIIIDTGLDLSTATNPEIHYRKPDGSTGEWSATIDGENVVYQTSGNDIDQKGAWEVQTSVMFGTANKKSDIEKIQIDEPIKDD